MQKKIELKDLDKINLALAKKTDNDYLNGQLNLIKTEVFEDINLLKNEVVITKR